MLELHYPPLTGIGITFGHILAFRKDTTLHLKLQVFPSPRPGNGTVKFAAIGS